MFSYITKLISDFVTKLGSSCTHLRHLYTLVHVSLFRISQDDHCLCICRIYCVKYNVIICLKSEVNIMGKL